MAEILEYFKDINFMYNDCSMHDILAQMLSEFEAEIRAKVLEEVQAKFRSDYEAMRTNGIEDCINWADWVDRIVAGQLKGE